MFQSPKTALNPTGISQAITMLLVVIFAKFHKFPIGFVKGVQRRFRISKNLGFAKGFLGLPKSGNRSKSDWEFPSDLDAFLLI